MPDTSPAPAAAWSARRRGAAACICACLLAGWPWPTSSASGQPVASRAGDHEPDGAGAAPPRFGYYATRWRRWPEAGPATAGNAKGATPAPPPRLEIPGALEESPPRAGDDPPARAAASGVGGATRDGLAAEQGAQRLARQAAAAKAGTREQQAQFTRQLVAELLAAHDPELRCRIVATAAEFDTPEAHAICAGGLQDPNHRVRMTACAAWGRRGGADAVRLLSDRCESDADLGVRLRALAALAELDDETAIPAIARALDDADPVVQKRAMQSLKRLSGRDLGNDVAAWRAWAAAPDRAPPRWSWLEALRKLF